MLKNAVDKLNWDLVCAGDVIRAQAEGFPVRSFRVRKSCLCCEGEEIYGIIDYDVLRCFRLKRRLRRFFHMKDYIVWELRIPTFDFFK